MDSNESPLKRAKEDATAPVLCALTFKALFAKVIRKFEHFNLQLSELKVVYVAHSVFLNTAVSSPPFVDFLDCVFLAHLSTECSVSYCDHPPSVGCPSVRRPSIILSVIFLLTL